MIKIRLSATGGKVCSLLNLSVAVAGELRFYDIGRISGHGRWQEEGTYTYIVNNTTVRTDVTHVGMMAANDIMMVRFYDL